MAAILCTRDYLYENVCGRSDCLCTGSIFPDTEGETDSDDRCIEKCRIDTEECFERERLRKVLYSELLISGKLNDYLAVINEQAEEVFSRLVKQLAEKEGVTEALKAENLMLWVQKMNSIRNTAMEVVSNDLIYA